MSVSVQLSDVFLSRLRLEHPDAESFVAARAVAEQATLSAFESLLEIVDDEFTSHQMEAYALDVRRGSNSHIDWRAVRNDGVTMPVAASRAVEPDLLTALIEQNISVTDAVGVAIPRTTQRQATSALLTALSMFNMVGREIKKKARRSVELLLEAGAPPTAAHLQGCKSSYGPLHYVGDVDVIRLLLDYGADPTERRVDAGGIAALHTAVTRYSPEMVRCLLDAGAPIDAVDDRGHTALRLAADVQREHREVRIDSGYHETVANAEKQEAIAIEIKKIILDYQAKAQSVYDLFCKRHDYEALPENGLTMMACIGKLDEALQPAVWRGKEPQALAAIATLPPWLVKKHAPELTALYTVAAAQSQKSWCSRIASESSATEPQR